MIRENRSDSKRRIPIWLGVAFGALGIGIATYTIFIGSSDSAAAVLVPIAVMMITLATRGLLGKALLRERLSITRILAIVAVLAIFYFTANISLPTWVWALVIVFSLSYAWLRDIGKVP